jgi:hypothetical protein
MPRRRARACAVAGTWVDTSVSARGSPHACRGAIACTRGCHANGARIGSRRPRSRRWLGLSPSAPCRRGRRPIPSRRRTVLWGCLREGTGSPSTLDRSRLTSAVPRRSSSSASLRGVCDPRLCERRARIAIGKEDRDPAATEGWPGATRGRVVGADPRGRLAVLRSRERSTGARSASSTRKEHWRPECSLHARLSGNSSGGGGILCAWARGSSVVIASRCF